jgi:DNA-binding HxlR family transcriptional regulator
VDAARSTPKSDLKRVELRTGPAQPLGGASSTSGVAVVIGAAGLRPDWTTSGVGTSVGKEQSAPPSTRGHAPQEARGASGPPLWGYDRLAVTVDPVVQELGRHRQTLSILRYLCRGNIATKYEMQRCFRCSQKGIDASVRSLLKLGLIELVARQSQSPLAKPYRLTRRGQALVGLTIENWRRALDLSWNNGEER